MIWFKDTGRVVNACARLTNEELGLLYRLICYAWERQGITETDVPTFAHRMREPIENAHLAFADMQSVAEERDGKWLLPEQWEGIVNYKQKVEAGKLRQKQRKEEALQETKDLPDSPLKHRSSDAEQNRIEENRVEPSVLDKGISKQNKKKKIHGEPAASPAVVDVFSFWQDKLKHPQSILTPKRKQAIVGRLKEGYTPEHIKRGIIGCANSEWHCGKNDSQRPFDDIELICRTGEKLEHFIAIADKTAQPEQRTFR